AWLRFRRGDTAGAHEYAVRQLAVAEQLGAMLPLAGGHFIVAQTAQALGGREKAAHHVSRSLHYGERMDSDFIRFMGRMAEAQYALEAEERETARRQLGEAFALGRRHGYTNWLLFHPSSAHRLCRFALDKDIEPEYAAWLMEQRDLETEPGSHAPLRVHCLGRFQVFRNNRPLFTGKRVPKRPLALLKALLSAGGRPVSKAVLLDRLWPDADGDAASSALSTNLRRLRRLLGTADAVRLERGQLSIDPQRCIVDAFHFGERLSAPPEPLSDQQLHETVALYQGPYLEGELDDPATNAERQRLRRLYASGVNELATRLSNHGDEDAAMTLWESALATDPTAGPLCHALMAWHADRGRHAEARAVYLRCRDLLYAAGEAPSEPLVTLYRKIPSEPLL
ncbi:MAG TPA: bacterial transcriptional activator domain-containing protein, partial [Gammaproteobacteria bacterium]|nr:bacterial transcriptional activator domain-containing protein [Gammaproteobacteria bacterium]